MMKTQHTRSRRELLQPDKECLFKKQQHKKPTGNITFNGERLHVFCLRSGKDDLTSQHMLEVVASTI